MIEFFINCYILQAADCQPHIAGKEQNKVLAGDIYNQWRRYKFDEVEMRDYMYNVLLSYINRSNYNSLNAFSLGMPQGRVDRTTVVADMGTSSGV